MTKGTHCKIYSNHDSFTLDVENPTISTKACEWAEHLTKYDNVRMDSCNVIPKGFLSPVTDETSTRVSSNNTHLLSTDDGQYVFISHDYLQHLVLLCVRSLQTWPHCLPEDSVKLYCGELIKLSFVYRRHFHYCMREI